MSADGLTHPAPDGRSREDEISLPSRRRLIAAGTALGVAGLFLGSSPLGPSIGQADLVRTVKGFLHLDPIVTNFAFEMEELEKDFFSRATLSEAYRMLPPKEKALFALIAQEDAEHFKAIKSVRGRRGEKGAGNLESPNGSGSRRPKVFTYSGKVFSDRDALYTTALDIKETVLFAYHGAVDLVDKDTLKLAGAIAGVEGRHATLLRVMWGQDGVPAPFESSLGAQAAGRKLARYGFRGGGPDAVTN